MIVRSPPPPPSPAGVWPAELLGPLPQEVLLRRQLRLPLRQVRRHLPRADGGRPPLPNGTPQTPKRGGAVRHMREGARHGALDLNGRSKGRHLRSIIDDLKRGDWWPLDSLCCLLWRASWKVRHIRIRGTWTTLANRALRDLCPWQKKFLPPAARPTLEGICGLAGDRRRGGGGAGTAGMHRQESIGGVGGLS